jgi:hypothetical protein
MTQPLIIYPNDEGQALLLWPVPNCGLSLYEIGRKDVPAGKPFKIIDTSYLPPQEQSIFLDALEADFSNPDGYGVGHDVWYAEQRGT